MKSVPRRLVPSVQVKPKDWGGEFMPKAATELLYPTCIVRVCVDDTVTGAGEAIYFEITKIKDGTFWGKALDTYRLFEIVPLHEGDQFTWRAEHINEIPLNVYFRWQPKKLDKLVNALMQNLPNSKRRFDTDRDPWY